MSPATAASASSGTRRARARACRWPSTPARSRASRRWRTRPPSSSPTATTSTTSSSAPSRAVRTCSDSRRHRQRAAPTCARNCRSPRAAWCSRRSRSSTPRSGGDTHPSLSSRRNIVVIADEAHRSQYDFIDGFARHMRDALPNASFVGFTGTPIEKADANTRAVFGDYISIYDIQRAVFDGATVPIYYESRLAKLALDEDERSLIDDEFEEATEGEEVERKERLKTRWGATRGHRRRRAACQSRRRGHRRALRTAPRRHRGQGDGGLHEPPHLHRPLPRARAAAPRVGARGRRQGRDQGGDDRIRLGPAGLAAAHPQQGAPRGSREALPRRRRPAGRSSSCATCG